MNRIKLKQIRKLKGLTLQALADRCGSSKSYMWELENKNTNPSAMLLFKIASVLKCSIECLVDAYPGHDLNCSARKGAPICNCGAGIRCG